MPTDFREASTLRLDLSEFESGEPAAPPQHCALEDQIRAATRTGGLTQLPPDFDEPTGGWTTITSTNPFEVLFLDHRQAAAISAEVIAAHYRLIGDFWAKKLGFMRMSGSRSMILRKYGGEHESEKLIESYPKRLREAFERLETPEAIENVLKELEAESRKRAQERLEEKLSDYLVDRTLQPVETRALFEYAASQNLRVSEVADYVHSTLVGRGLQALGHPVGKTLAEQLISVPWGDSGFSRPERLVDKGDRRFEGLRRIAQLTALIATAFIAVAFLIRESRVPASVKSTDSGVVNSRGGSVSTPIPTPPLVQVSLTPAAREPRPSAELARATQARKQQDAAETARRRRVEACKSIVEGLGETIAVFQSQERFEEARTQIGVASTECAGLGAEIASELSTLAALGRQVAEAEVSSRVAALAAGQEAKAWRDKIAVIDSELANNQLIEARDAASRIMADPTAPPDIAEKASLQRLEAIRRIKEAFEGFSPGVSSKQVRPAKRPGGGTP
ncbi:MAG: hypothetical protein IPJ17_12935 [Holophagales bacterium]|nr:MAG: hypothetical protein IPJ17_12935 [Holophagales bacterium]